MNKIFTIMLLALLGNIAAQAQEADYQPEELYFPTGTVWEEVVIDPFPFLTDSYPPDTIRNNLYEIGGDTIINENSYKCVLMNGKLQDYWVREQDGLVWVLSNLYPSEIKIYDFNWDGAAEHSFEYLSVNIETGDMEVISYLVPSSQTRSVIYNDELYWYVVDGLFGDTIVDKIGRIKDVDLNCALLGAIMFEPVLPGLIYSKVLWLNRNERLVFESNSFEKAVNSLAADVTGDGKVDISDVNEVINVVLGKSVAAADVNGDGVVDISDVNMVINAMLGKIW